MNVGTCLVLLWGGFVEKYPKEAPCVEEGGGGGKEGVLEKKFAVEQLHGEEDREGGRGVKKPTGKDDGWVVRRCGGVEEKNRRKRC